MVILVVTIGMLNLALGYALGEFLVQGNGLSIALPQGAVLPKWKMPLRWPWRRSTTDVSGTRSDVVTSSAAAACEKAAGADVVVPEKCFVEGLLWTLRDELRGYRQQLVAADERMRADPDADAADEKIVEANQLWLQRLNAWTAELSAAGDDSAQESLRVALEDLLLDHSFEVSAAADALKSCDGEPSGRQGRIHEMCRLVAAANTLSGRLDERLAGFLRDAHNLATLTEAVQFEDQSEAHSRLGLEVLVEEWWSKDPHRVRLISGVLLDVDRVSNLNEQVGLSVGDKTLAAFGRFLKSLIRRDRGFDRVTRLTGQRFLLFLGDTAAPNAVNAAERIRQTIEAASFHTESEDLQLTASIAVAEITKTDTLPTFLERLSGALSEAKKAGRNRTALDDGEGPQVVEPPHYTVKGCVINV